MTNRKEFIESITGLSSAVQILRLTTIILFIIVLLLTICLVKAINRQQIFIKVDEDGKAIPTEILEDNAFNLINYKQFLTDFLERAYCWTPSTFQRQIESALPLMDEEAQIYFRKELKQNQTYEIITKNKITNILIVKYIDTSSIKPTDYGWLINVDALKLRIIEVENTQGIFSTKPVPVRFTIGFKTAPISRENIWGFKVCYLYEEEIIS